MGRFTVRISRLGMVGIIAFGAFGTGCGTSAPDASDNPNLALLPGFAMASIVAGSTLSNEESARTYQPLNLSTFSLLDQTGEAVSSVEIAPTETSLGGYSAELAKIQAIAQATSETACFSGIDFNIQSAAVDCYGPQLVVLDYPGVSSTNFNTGGTCPVTAGTSTLGDTSIGDGCLPSGDAGIYASAQSGEACSAAKMNSLLSDVGAIINNALKINAGIVCYMGLEGRAKLAAGSLYNAKLTLADKIPASTFTAAKIERGADDEDGNEVYTTTLEGVVPAGSADLALKLSIVTKNKADGTESKGRVHGYFDREIAPGTTVRKGFSATYKVAGSAVGFDLRSAITANTDTEATLFDEDGVYQYAPFTAGGMTSSTAQYLVASLDAASGAGKMVYAWQAGAADSHARVFQVEATAAEDAVTAYSYFAFGPPVSSSSIGTIETMICNWAPPSGGAARALQNGKAQAQVMELDADTGKFVVASGGDHFLFYPTANCDFPGGDYRVGTSLSDVAGAAPGVTANALATYNDAAIGVFTAPTAPSLE